MRQIYLCDDKRKTNIHFWGSNFVQEGALELDICQAKTHDSHVSLNTKTDIYILIIPFYIPCWFYLWYVVHSIYNFTS